MRFALAFLCLMIFGLGAFGQAGGLIRQPMTTNLHFGPLPLEGHVPIWNATAGKWSNNIVSFDDRQGGSALLSNLVANPYTGYTNQVFGGTNISVRTAGGTNFIDTIGELNNWASYSTNVWNSRQGGSLILTNLSGTGALTNANALQPANANLTNWALYSTNTWNDRQGGSLNLTNWSNIPTGAMANVVSTTFLTNWANAVSNYVTAATNSASVTNWITQRQLASAILTNLSGTGAITNLIGVTNSPIHAAGNFHVTNQLLRVNEEFNGKTVFTNLDFTGSIIKTMTNAITGSRTNNLTNAVGGASMIVYVLGDTATATDFNYTFTAASANIRWVNATTNSNGIDVLIHSNQVYVFRFDVVTNATGPATNIIASWMTDSPRPILNDPIPISAGAGTSNAWVGGVVFLDAITATTNLQATAVYTNLFTFTIPANTLTNLGDELEFYLAGNFRFATANTNGFKCIYGTSTLFDTGFLTISNCPWKAIITITRTGNSTQRVETEVIAQTPAAGSFGNATLTAYRTNMPLAQVNGVTNIFAFQGTSRVVAAITNDYRRIKWNSGPKGSVP
jgi:hypothetical protein